MPLKGANGQGAGMNRWGRPKRSNESPTQSTHTEDLMGKHCARPGGEGMRQGESREGEDAVLVCLQLVAGWGGRT